MRPRARALLERTLMMKSFTLVAVLGLCAIGCAQESGGEPDGEDSTGGKSDGVCTDGSAALCEIVPPTCSGGLVLKIEDGCYAGCVDPDTCQAPGESSTITSTELVQ